MSAGRKKVFILNQTLICRFTFPKSGVPQKKVKKEGLHSESLNHRFLSQICAEQTRRTHFAKTFRYILENISKNLELAVGRTKTLNESQVGYPCLRPTFQRR